jgi:hypothetical protein
MKEALVFLAVLDSGEGFALKVKRFIFSFHPVEILCAIEVGVC